MSRDLRNEFLDNVKLAVMEFDDADIIVSKVAMLLDHYELSERVTDLVQIDNENVNMLKTYTSSMIIDGRSKTTIQHYIRELKNFNSYINGKDFKDVNAYDVRSYLAKRKLDGLSNRTLDNIRSILVAFYGWMNNEDYMSKNPCVCIKPIKYTDEVKLPFSNVEIDKLRSACKNTKERAIIEFLLASGVRVAEFCDLNVEDVDFFENKIRIRHGKGDKERYTYMNDLAKEHLLRYLDGRTAGALFRTKRQGRYTKGGVRYLLHSLEKRAGIDDVHPHRFRRTFATSLASRGMRVQEIQKLLGHANINTTMVYVSLSDADTKYSYMKFA